KGSEEWGRPAIARPFARVADHGHTPCRGGRPWPAPLQGRPSEAKAFCRGSRLQKAIVPPVARPQGAAPWQGNCRSQGATAASAGVTTAG
ncbi:hypothetical protein GW17_00040046, partial [Ensete ventricosum]